LASADHRPEIQLQREALTWPPPPPRGPIGRPAPPSAATSPTAAPRMPSSRFDASARLTPT
jgi:hypothetical protein